MAPIPADCIHVSFVFDLYDGGQAIEQGVFGFHGQRKHTTGNPVDWEADIQELADKMHAKFLTGVPQPLFSPAIIMNRVDCYHLSTANKTLDKGSRAFTPIGEWTGGAGTGMPWECATVVSLYGYNPGSFRQNARNARGRFYLPPLRKDATDSSNGLLATATQADMVSWLGDWLNDVQGSEMGSAAGPGGDPDYFDLGILSTQRKSQAGYDGAFTPATYFRVGRVIDVQRRRRKKQNESYQTAVINHS